MYEFCTQLLAALHCFNPEVMDEDESGALARALLRVSYVSLYLHLYMFVCVYVHVCMYSCMFTVSWESHDGWR
jgi:hypothetical protein